MDISKISSTNFQARLDVSKIHTNKARWGNIANHFAELTPKYPKGLIKVVENKNNIRLSSGTNIKNDWIDIITSDFNKKQLENLMEKKSDFEIANILTKFYKLGNFASHELSRANKFATRMAENSEICGRSSDDIYNYFYDEAYSIIENKVLDKANKNAVMKSWKISI